MHLYVTEQGTRLSKQGEHLIISKDGSIKSDILMGQIESVAFFGAVHPTTDAMLALLNSGTDISFLSRGGRFKGRLVSSTSKNVSLRIKQYEAFHEQSKAFSIAKSYVVQKLQNGLHVLDAYHNNSHNSFHFDERAQYIKNLQATEKLAGFDRDILRGYEGYGAKLYFACLSRCFTNNFGFCGRDFYPSKDPVNALLSLGYSFVSHEIESLLEAYGLDPMIGFLHDPSYGRASLACDLVEEFRHPFVDRLALKLLNCKILSAEDFESGSGECSEQLYLKQDAMRIFLRHYEEFCNAANRIYKGSENISWRNIFRLRVESLRKSLLENEDIIPFELRSDLLEAA